MRPSDSSHPASPPAADPAEVTLTRKAKGDGSQANGRAGVDRQARLPHERDQHPDSQTTPQAPNHEVGQQAFSDVSHGLVDTDEGLRKTSVDRRSAAPVQPTGKTTPPRQAMPLKR